MTTPSKEPAQTAPHPSTAPALSAPLEIEGLRFSGEGLYAANLMQLPGLAGLADQLEFDPVRIRRALMARSLLLSPGMAPAAHAAARDCAGLFGITETIELYQAAGAENAAMHAVRSPVLLEIQGRLLSLLDAEGLRAVMGHELGHYLAHGQDSPHRDASLAAHLLLNDEAAPAALVAAAQRLSMAKELTADRFGLLAAGGLEAALRLEMAVVTGLPADAITWDTSAYLAQSRELMEGTLAEGQTTLGGSHPEHSLRAWALWLFSETDLYHRLTGLGGGGRTLAEVDGLLLRVLGMPALEMGEPTLLEEPPPEMHECALAACVLMAAADGELHDLELKAIERVFAPLVPGWRELLDPETALSRFQSLAPLLQMAEPKIQRALFTLLAHVLAADGECHQDEVDLLVAIGSALGCRQLFLALLPPLLSHFGLELELHREVPAIPMPARSGEAQEALRVYFEVTARRGGGQVTLRRLLRLLGERRLTEAARTALEEIAHRTGLSLEPPLETTEGGTEHGQALDAPRRLTPIAPAEPKPETESIPANRDGLRRGIARLRDRLISGDGRSPSIRLRGCRSGRAVDLHQLEEVRNGASERALTLIRAGKRVELVSGPEIEGHEGARRLAAALVALERERRARQDETGADDLFLGYPFLSGRGGGYLFRAPLLLHPVRILRDNQGGAAIRLEPSPEEPAIANQSALRLLFHRKGLPYPDTLSERFDQFAAEGAEAVLGELDRLGLRLIPPSGQLVPFGDRLPEMEGWLDDRLELEECAVIGLFPQSSSELLQDYDELLAEMDASGGDASGGAPPDLGAAGRLLPPGLRPASAVTDQASPANPLSPVLYADPIQRQVLERARTTQALVVDGPPGTGKSQVIVNLVADALARGQKVAVVCEKRAALDVVVNRLEGVGLRHLLAVVHDVQEDRRPLYRQLAQRLEEEGPRASPGSALTEVLEAANREDDLLAQHGAALAVRHGGLALGQLHTLAAGIATGLKADGAGDLPSHPSLATLSWERMERLAEQMKRLQPHAELWRDGSPWRDPAGLTRRTSLADWDEAGIRGFRDALRRAVEAGRNHVQARDQVLAQSGQVDLEALRNLEPALQVVIASRAMRRDEADARSFAALLAAGQGHPERLRLLQTTLGIWQQHGTAARRLRAPVRLALPPWFKPAIALLDRLRRAQEAAQVDWFPALPTQTDADPASAGQCADPAWVQAREGELREALAAHQQWLAAAQTLGMRPDDPRIERIEAVRPALRLVVESRGERRDPGDRSLFAALLGIQTNLDAPIREAQGLWAAAGVAVRGWDAPVVLRTTPEFESTLAVFEAGASSPLRWLRPDWWRAQRAVRGYLAAHWPERASGPMDAGLPGAIRARREQARCWEALHGLIAHLGLIDQTPPNGEAALRWLHRLPQVMKVAGALRATRATLQPLGLWPRDPSPAALDAWDRRVDAVRQWLAARRRFQQALAPVRATWDGTQAGVREALTPLLPQASRAALDESLIDALRERSQAAQCWQAFWQLRTALGMTPDELGDAEVVTHWLGRLVEQWRVAGPLLKLGPSLQGIGAWPKGFTTDGLAEWDRRVDLYLTLLASHAAVDAAWPPIREVLPWMERTEHPVRLEELADRWDDESARLVDADRLLGGAQAIHADSGELVQGMAQRLDGASPQGWYDDALHLWSRSAIHALAGREPAIRLLDQGDPAAGPRGQTLRRLLSEQAQLTIQELLARQDASAFLRAPQAEKHARRTEVQAAREAMLKEAKKQRNIPPLRAFVRRFLDQGLLEALPVWLVSPETMTMLFPRAPRFDLVIIDEASQCTVENGLPVLMRARRAVIAGDERQMPPTNFFRSTGDEEETAAAEPDEAREMFDGESLLVLARRRVEHLGLGWHYRCLHEELIAFSNHAIYGGGLHTIPSVASRLAPAAVRWVAVEDGAYDKGINLPEAAQVVELMYQLLVRDDRPSLGVVTFNLAQRRAILDEIDRRRAEGEAFSAAFDRAMANERVDERPFVKNLESVQGDERDIILFSLGHAPVERTRRDGRVERYVPARFGPLGQRGGERRLNVAISRAKREIIVVASFDPALLTVARSKHEGPRLFKGFLEFAWHLASGNRNQAERLLTLMGNGVAAVQASAKPALPSAYVPLKTQIALTLQELGHACELDVGTSDFRVPIAVMDPADPCIYRLGILCDEGDPLHPPLEAHVHVPGVLEARGWNLIRVHAREWDRSRGEVLRRIQNACNAPSR